MNLFDLVTPNTTILTPNSRLTVSLAQQFQLAQLQQQKTVWPTLDVLPITRWLERCWREIAAHEFNAAPLLLSASQESILWEEIIRDAADYDFLLQKSATAELAKTAWETLKSWCVAIDDPALQLTDDSCAFQTWGNEFAARCKKNNWLDKNSLPDFIGRKLIFKLPQKIILIGFAEISPQYQQLFNAFEQAGCEVIHYQSEKTAQTTQKIALLDEDHEIRTMARWAKTLYQHQPDATPYRIGCVILNLDKLRSKVLQIFCETFAEPDTFTFDNRTLPFNVTAGQYLLDFPVIRTAFDLLELQQGEISLDKFSNLLRSPFIGDAESEQIKRANFETRLRNANMATIDIDDLLQKNTHYNLANAAPKFAKRLQQFRDTCSAEKKIKNISEWVNDFLALLALTGWPGERSVNSFEFQVIDSWLELLNEFSTFDLLLGKQSFSQALYYLTQLTAKKVFQPKSPEAPIQILGVLEAVELPFEHLWVMGLDDTRWPAAPKPNPFIPQRLQKKLHMPHATAERELQYCQQLMQQLSHTAQHLIFSHAEKNDEADLQPSALLADIPEIKIENLALTELLTPAQIIFQQKKLESLVDSQAPAIREQNEIHGGTRIFALQAACPFKAFAELRLHARRLETPTLGLRPIDRGNIVHKALELVWRDIQNSTRLVQLASSEIHTIVQQAVQAALENNMTDVLHNQRYLELEKLRLERVLLNWLQIEMGRPAFTVVKQEFEREVTIGKIVLTVRVDRIDEFHDGTHMIIDYKTGKHNEIKNWFGERPDEPQLPLYCVTDNESNIAIAFAQLHPNAMQFTGVGKRDVGIASIKLLAETNCADTDLWSQQIEEWRKVLEKLANDFYHGVANVDPKKGEESCHLCNLQPFCRIYEKV